MKSNVLAGTIVLAHLLSFGAAAASVPDLTGEFAVSSAETGTASQQAVTMDSQGEILVVWADAGIEGRRFDRDGVPLGNDFQIGSPALTFVNTLDASLDAGGFTVAWGESGNHEGSRSVLSRFDAAGGPVTEVVVGNGARNALAGNGRGNSVVLTTTDDRSVVGRRFSAAARSVGPVFPVTQVDRGVAVAMDGRGRFVVVWASEQALWGRRYDAAARPLGSPFRISPEAASGFVLRGNAAGSFVVAWYSEEQQTIYARRYGSAGSGGPLQAVAQAQSRVWGFAAAMDAAGRFLIAWGQNRSPHPSRIFGRFFAASGKPQGSEFQITLGEPAGDDSSPAAAAGPAGEFAVVWIRNSADSTSRNQLIGRRLSLIP